MKNKGILNKILTGVSGLALVMFVGPIGGLFGPCTAEASIILGFSDFSSDKTPASVLTATVTFIVSNPESQLRIDIHNTSDYEIAQLYFNSDRTLTGLDFFGTEGVNFDPSWDVSGSGLSHNEKAGGFGKFNWLIDFGSGDSRLGSGLSLTLNMADTTSETTIGHKLSSIPPGSIQALAVMKFEAGPGDDSAFGATKTVVPLPETLLLFASGLLALVAGKKIKKA